jgi:hypothetical protein
VIANLPLNNTRMPAKKVLASFFVKHFPCFSFKTMMAAAQRQKAGRKMRKSTSASTPNMKSDPNFRLFRKAIGAK